MTIEVTQLFVARTASRLYQLGLEVAQALGLPVTSWRTGDPTRSLYKFLATALATAEQSQAEYNKAGFLSTAEGDWKTVVADEVYGVDRPGASYATPTVTVTNTGGGFYEIAANDLTFKASDSGKTYHNTNAVTIASGPSATLYVFELEADEAGTGSNCLADDIDEMVTTRDGVVIASSTAATASDELDDDALQTQCDATLGALSPNGPPDAYEYVVRNSELTGTAEITRAKSSHDAIDGTVTVYIAGPNGAVSGDAVTAAQNAVERWATPLCSTPTVVTVPAETIDVTATLLGDLPADFEDLVEGALETLFSKVDLGGLVAVSAIEAAIHGALPALKSVNVTLPPADVSLDAGQAPDLGALDLTEV